MKGDPMIAATVSKIMGVVFLLVGILGFFSGHELMGFGVNAAHNIVHLASGALALWAGFNGEKYARMYCLGFGAVYGLVTILGFLNVPFVIELLNINQADNFLHLAITAVLIFAGLSSKTATVR
jgi:hypothetical protein